MTTHARFYSNYIALITMLNKEIYRFMRIWTQTLLPPAITMSLYFIIFGKFIGGQLRDIEGYRYIQYIVPGLVMMAMMTNAYSNTSTSFFLGKFNKSIEEMLVSPMNNIIILVGYMLGGTVRGVLVGTVVLFISYLFTHVPIHHPLIVISMAILATTVFSLGGLINAIYAKRFDDIAFVPTFILTPLTYLGGVFYSISQLPPAWQAVSYFNPVLAMVDTFRFGLLGISDVNIVAGFALVIFMLLVLFFFAWRLLNKGVGIKV